VKITEGIESQAKHIEGISSYLAHLERVDKQQDEKNRRQDERYAKSQKELKELKGRLEEREKQKEERDKETAKRLLILEKESKERSRVENLMNEAWGRTIGPATQQGALVLTLEEEIRTLERRKIQRWHQLIEENKWDDHENDQEVISIQKLLEEKRVAKGKIEIEMETERKIRTVKPTTVHQPHSPPEWGQEAGSLATNPNYAPQQWQRFSWGNSTSPHDPETEPSPWGRSRRRSPSLRSNSRSRSPNRQEIDDFHHSESDEEEKSVNEGQEPKTHVDHFVDREDLEYLVLIKVKKGEKKAYVKNMLEEDVKGFHGPFELSSDIQHLMDHNKRANKGPGDHGMVHEPEKKEKEVQKIGFEELMESERRKKKRRSSEEDKKRQQ
jgi:hypothetical protein